MIGIIFEVWPKNGQQQEYLDMAAEMRNLLDDFDGFVSVERFQSLSDPDKLLSLSFFRDQDAVQRWRNMSEHRQAQAAGRQNFFDNYRIRVVECLRDYSRNERSQAPQDSQAIHNHKAVSAGCINPEQTE